MANYILRNLFDNQIGMDIRLKVEEDEREIKAHRLILMGASKYFQSMFDSDFQEKDVKLVTMKKLSFETLKMLIEFIYTGTFYNNGRTTMLPSEIRNCIMAADYFLVDEVIIFLGRILKMDRNIKEATLCLDIVDKLPNDTRVAIAKMVATNMDKLRPELIELEFEPFFNVLKNPHSVPLDVKTTLITIKEWVLYAPDDRNEFAFELLSTVVFRKSDGLDIKFLIENVLLICTTPKCKDFLFALYARINGYKDSFTEQYLDDSKFLNDTKNAKYPALLLPL